MGSRINYSSDRAQRVLAYLSTPRTMADVLAHFGGSEQARFAVYNLVKRGHVINLERSDCGRKAGRFVAAVEASPARDRSDGGAALAQAWGMRA